jgi:hypothetical protein
MWYINQKKVILSLFILSTLFSSGASAHDYYRTNTEWAAPLIIGGIIGYVIKGQQQQRPLIINQPSRIVSPPGAAPLYQYQWVFDPNCNCQYQVLVQIN